MHTACDPLPFHPVWVPEEPDENEPGDEAANMCPVRHASSVGGRYAQRCQAGEELEDEPKADEDDRGKVKEDRYEPEEGDCSH